MTLRFGIMLLQERSADDVVAWSQRFDEAGADSLWVADHAAYPQHVDKPWYSGWDLLSAMAVVTTRSRIGPLVSTFQLHSPLAMARHVVTVNSLSKGRLDLGLGAGGGPVDRASEGVLDGSVSELMARFDSGTAATMALLRGEPLALPEVPALYGRAAPELNSIALNPQILPNPMTPIVIGGQGARTIEVAAKYADRWNTYGSQPGAGDVFDNLARNSALLDERIAEYGRRPEDVIRSVLLDFNPQLSPLNTGELVDVTERLYDLGFSEVIAYAWADGHVTRSADELLNFVSNELPALRAGRD